MKTLLSFLLFSALLFGGGFYITKEDLGEIQKKYGDAGVKRASALIEFMNQFKDVSDVEKLVAVNKFFNQVQYATDMQVWKENDYWATTEEFLGKGAGDCEDYAISKYFALIKLGIPEDNLYLSYVKAVQLNQAHMVLTYFKDKKSIPLVLDNINQKILPANQRTDLAPVYSFNAKSLYLAKQQGLGTAVPGGNEQNKKWVELLGKTKMN